LFSDQSIVPVRGQLTRLVPQPEVNYGLTYRNVFVVPRRDGIVLQYFAADERRVITTLPPSRICRKPNWL